MECANQEMEEAEEPLDSHVAAVAHAGEERLWHQDLTEWIAVSGAGGALLCPFQTVYVETTGRHWISQPSVLLKVPSFCDAA